MAPLTIAEHEAMLACLSTALTRLAELRGGLLCEHEWRRRKGPQVVADRE